MVLARYVLTGFVVVASLLGARTAAQGAVPTIDLDRIAQPSPAPIGRPMNTPYFNFEVESYDDAGRPLGITDVTAPDFHGFSLRDPVTRSSWIRFALRSSDGHRPWVFTCGTDIADVYLPDEAGRLHLSRIGWGVPFLQWPFHEVPVPAVPLPRSALGGRPIYLHISGFPNCGIVDEALLIAFESRKQAELLFWSGLKLAFVLSNIALFMYLRDRTFFYYALALTAWFGYGLIDNGLAWALLWPGAAVSPQLANGAVGSLVVISVTLFARSVLQLSERAKTLDRLLLAVTGVLAAYNFAYRSSIFDWLNVSSESLATVSSFGFAILLAAAGVIAWRRGVNAARFYMIGFAGFTFFATLGIAAPSLHVALPWPLTDGQNTGITWEALFLTVAVADSLLRTRKEAFDALTAREHALAEVARTQEASLERLDAQNRSMQRFVPQPFLDLLERRFVEELRLGDHTLRDMTLLFSDIRSFTTLAESMSAEDTFAFLNSYLAHAGPVIRDHGGFIDKYVGDAIFALFAEGTQPAVDAAIALQATVDRYNQQRARAAYAPIAIGVGLHRGRLALGAIGEDQRIETTVIADAVNIASRLEGLTKIFGARIIVSAAVIDALDDASAYRIRPLGPVQVAGAYRSVEVYEVFDGDPPGTMLEKHGSLDRFAAALDAYRAGRFADAASLFDEIATRSPGDGAARYYAARSLSFAADPPPAWDGTERMESKA